MNVLIGWRHVIASGFLCLYKFVEINWEGSKLTHVQLAIISYLGYEMQ